MSDDNSSQDKEGADEELNVDVKKFWREWPNRMMEGFVAKVNSLGGAHL